MKTLALLILAVVASVSSVEYDHTKCFSSTKGNEYAGTLSKTRDGQACLRWDKITGKTFRDYKFPDATVAAADNYCRNPDSYGEGPYCYTAVEPRKWQYCKVPYCFGRVSSVGPRYIGEGGAVRITLKGKGFSINQFNFAEDSHVGNKVWFVNDLNSFECAIHKDGSTEDMIVCMSSKNMYHDLWHVRLSVDGIETPKQGICGGNRDSWYCSIVPHGSYTSYISKISPRSGPADGLITIHGKFFSDLYGPNAAEASNGRPQKISRVYVGGISCDLKDGDEFYGLKLTSGDYGYIKCKITDLGAALNNNVSVIIDGSFGRTKLKSSALHLSATGKIYSYQSYAEISSISPAVGSVAGGQLITITGRSFDQTKAPVSVKVGEEECVVKSVEDTKIVCRTPAKPAEEATYYPGNRGVYNHFFNTSVVSFDNFDQLFTRTDKGTKTWSDGTYWQEGDDPAMDQIASGTNYYNMVTQGFLIVEEEGDYRFHVKVDDQAKVFLSNSTNETAKELVAFSKYYTSNSYTKYGTQKSVDKYHLKADTPYPIEVQSLENVGGAYMYMGASLYKTSLVERIPGKVEPEEQQVQITSTVHKEKISLTLTGLSTRAAKKEVQVVEMTYTNSDGWWQLGIDGVYTDKLDVDVDERDLRTAINNLPSLYPEKVDVAKKNTKFTITFISELGNWPLMKKRTSSGVTVTVTGDTDGEASLSKWKLALGSSNGITLRSDMISTVSPSKDIIEDAVNSMFTARCPPSIGAAAAGKNFYEPFETSRSSGRFSGTVVYNEEPFCGKGSLKNPTRIFTGYIEITNKGHICFAYRGLFRDIIRVKFSSPGRSKHLYPLYKFSNSTDGQEWFYTCIDLLATIKESYSDESKYWIREVELYRHPFDTSYVDEVVIAPNPTSTNVEEVVNSMRTPLPVRVSSVSATKDEQTGIFTVDITPYYCAHNFEMISVYLAPKKSGNTAASSNTVTWGDNQGKFLPKDATIKIDRLQPASPPVTGKWSLTHGQITAKFAADVDIKSLRDNLALVYGLSDVKVTRSGTCHGYTHSLVFTQNSGDQPTLSVASVSLAGNGPKIILHEKDGHIFYDPIPGDMVVTRESSPQVRVSVNNIHSRCAGDCSYEWSAASTPTATGVNPTSGSLGVVLTIAGTGFSATPGNNEVKVGEANCIASEATATQIKCTLAVGVTGKFPVKVTVAGNGLASGSTEFTYDTPSITSIKPTSGSYAGGTRLTITGTGYDSTSKVTIDGKTCEAVTVKPSEIVCSTPDLGNSTGEKGVRLVVNEQRSKRSLHELRKRATETTVDSSDKFKYDASITPTVSSMTPTSLTVVGGEILTIKGTKFKDASSLEVTLTDSNDKKYTLKLDTTKTDDTNIVAPLPSLAPGTYTVRVNVKGVGDAKFEEGVSATFTIDLRMDAISTQKGSFEGGTRLAIAGKGFGTNKTMAIVKVGDRECEISEINDTLITCYTGRGSRTVTVTNGGIDPVRGLGYAWKPQTVEVMEGDRIRFKWVSAPFVDGNNIKVQETKTADGEHDGKGFSSGSTGSPNGEFARQFNTLGTYFYSTGNIGPMKNVNMKGKIVVTAKKAFAADVTVTVGGQKAELNKGSSVSITESVACAGTKAAMSSCTEDNPLSGEKFKFAYMDCLTPEVTEQDVVKGNYGTDITIKGKGFSSTACDNEVTVGEFPCGVKSQSETKLVCNLETGSKEPDIGLTYPVKVRVNNRGDAIQTAESTTYAMLPSVTSISPSSGSLNGGLLLTINGAGFVDAPNVMMSTAKCEIVDRTYTKITCKTSASVEWSGDIVVTVKNGAGALLPAECVNNCNFKYDKASTPDLSAVDSPEDIVAVDTELVISGSGFGTNTGAVEAKVGPEDCVVSAVIDNKLNCTVATIAAGEHDITVNVVGKGVAQGLKIKAKMSATSILPTAGSIWGGQEVTIKGVAFKGEETIVTINGVPCTVTAADPTKTKEIKCTTGPSAAKDEAEVVVDVKYGADSKVLKFKYDASITPNVTSVTPVKGSGGYTVTIKGTGFTTTKSDHTVTVGGVSCVVAKSSTTEIECELGGRAPGLVAVKVDVKDIGVSETDVKFTYEMSSNSFTPTEGSYGGGQKVTISGTGFVDGTKVTVCDKAAEVGETKASSVIFTTPSLEADFEKTTEKECNVSVTVGDDTKELTTKYTYKPGKTPQISEVKPARGGTQGGTKITIKGANFGGNNDNNVTIAGSVCDISSQSATEIICTTNAPGKTAKSNVIVETIDTGISMLTNSEYWFVDVWSSKFTWGGNPPPTKGDLVVVQEGQLLLLDQTTPVLKMVLIKGGELVFDEKDMTLKAENILIVGGGKLTVGTEDKPFEHAATIEMHGQLRATELPIYGAKCLAIREGELNIHGKPHRMTWTRLSMTATAGANQIKLEWAQLDWPDGATIAIATTGHRHSQKETEIFTIDSKSADGKTINLNGSLEFEHLGVTEDLGGGQSLEMRAEVAILSRNVRVIGSRDRQWSDDIKACPDGFDTGEFATQTCFQGRFGNEVGSDQFGAQIMFHAPVKDTKLAMGKLSYVEVNYAGQAFKLGRYPVHFHLNGDMNGSYVRGLAIHETFNRAVNIHGSHNILVEHTVIYNIMGGAFFLEDGIETGNRYYYNLALFVKASSSLLNDDITPAAFWATNPDNHYEHNAVAGGTHFGWWYRLLEHPEGPSATTSVCPRKVPLGTCNNNTVHSNGWFGLWTFQDYYPMVGGGCSSTTPEPAVFNKFTVWNCEKGLEFVNGGSLQFNDCLLANNEKAGVEGKVNMKLGTSAPYTDQGPLINNSVIAAYAPNHKHPSTGIRHAVILPWSGGYGVHNSQFINYDKKGEVVFRMTKIDGTCGELCGGWNYHFSGLKFTNGDQHIVNFRWLYDGVFNDLDGSLSGKAGAKILPWMNTLDPAKCKISVKFSAGAVEGAVCEPTMNFSRMSFNQPNMRSMLFKNVLLTNKFGTTKVPYADKRMTHKQGWTAVVEHKQNYHMVWENIEHITNLSYSVLFEDLQGGGVIFTHNISTKPDKIQIKPGVMKGIDEASSSKLSYENNVDGDFYFADNEKEFSYLVSDVMSRTKRATAASYVTKNMIPKTVKCYWPECMAPPDPNTLPPARKRPDNFVLWSDLKSWLNDQRPADNSDVTIDKGKWVIADMKLPVIKTLLLWGSLELPFEKNTDTNEYRDFKLEAEFIVIRGGRLVVGWSDNRFMGNVEIVLNGDLDTPPFDLPSAGSPIGVKAIAVFGGLDLHGEQRSRVKSTLSASVKEGDTKIVISDDHDWRVNEEIVIAPTSYDAQQAEVVKIQAVNGKELTVEPALKYDHLGESITDSKGNKHSLSATVALLTRNIVVRGGQHSNMDRYGVGGRIMIGSAAANNEKGETTAHTGWARLSYTQFKNMGQLGYTEAFDPRYAIAYVQTGDVSTIKPSELRGNSFHLGFSPAIGIFGASGIKIRDNVIYRVVGGGMVIHGDKHLIESNIIYLNLWTGSYNGRKEQKNVAYEASYEMVKARDTIFRDNIAAGSERAGIRVAGEPCNTPAKYERNTATSSLFGVMLLEGDEISRTCFQISGYTVWKNFDYGIYAQTPSDDVELNSNSIIENGLGVWTHTFGPGSLTHINQLKSVKVTKSYISGATQFFDCVKDVLPSSTNKGLSGMARSFRIGDGIIGFSLPNADGGPNGQPTHPFPGRMSYPTINARMKIEETQFANFGERTCGNKKIRDYAITSNPNADDVGFPLYIRSSTVEGSVDEESLAFFHRSNPGKVDPSNCVDMDCDGHKQNTIQDVDGTYLKKSGAHGTPGTILDDAAWQWDDKDDRRLGLGDYRIPKVMLTYPNSTRLDPPPNKGIYRGPDCTWMETWQAYKCFGTQYRLLVIESMDKDTEVRRLSPIGFKSRKGDFINLLNGPQDHGWCAGYTCQKRISTFWAVVAIGDTYDLYMTGTNPQRTKFYMLQAEASESVRLAVYYHSPQRLDVFSDDTYVNPTNAEITGDGDYKLKVATKSPPEWLPPLTASHGQNYFHRLWQLQYMILKGVGVVDVIIKEVVIVSLSMPPMTIDDFFGENIVNNLAIFLGVPANKIRVVDIVRETGSRRRRDAAGPTIKIEIGDAPTAGADISNVNKGTLNRDALLNLTRQVVDAVQLGTLGDALNVTIAGIDVQEPLPPPQNSTKSDWASLSNRSSLAAAIQIPDNMQHSVKLVADREQQPFPTQPQFSMFDSSGALVEVLGSRADPWKIRAVLRAGGSDNRAKLIGNTVCGFKDGVCGFETLGISHSGSGYIIDFQIFDPVAASRFKDVSSSISVKEAQLAAGFSSVPTKETAVNITSEFMVVVDIRDLSSQMRLQDVSWKGHTWSATVSMHRPAMFPATNLEGDLTQAINPATGLAIFTISLDTIGRFALKATVTSSPAGYTLTGRSSVIYVTDNRTLHKEERSYKFEMRINADYDTQASGNEDLVEAAMFNYLLSIDNKARYHDFKIRKGSIYFEFWVTGQVAPVDKIINTVKTSVGSSLRLELPAGALTFDKYLKLDDSFHGGLEGTEPEAMTSTLESVTAGTAGSSMGVIIGVTVGMVFLLIVIIAIIVVVMKKKGAKTGPTDEEPYEGVTRNSPVNDVVSAERVGQEAGNCPPSDHRHGKA